MNKMTYSYYIVISENMIRFREVNIPGNIVSINNHKYLVSDDGWIGLKIHKSLKNF
jgi:hypothetical protein